MKKHQRPRGSLWERRPGSWRLAVSAGFDHAGKRQQHYKTVKATSKDEAANELARFIVEVEDGLTSDGKKIALRDYMKTWLDQTASHVKPSTLRRYRADVDRFIVPTLGGLKLSQLGAKDGAKYLAAAYATWQQTREDGRDGTRSANTILHVARILHSAFSVAMQHGLMDRNPAEKARKPRLERKEMRCFNREQAQILLASSANSPMELPIALGLGCGMRRSEMLGLRWKDVDFTRGVLVVAQSLDFDPKAPEGKRLTFRSPKSGRSRGVAMPALVLEALRRYKVRQNEQRLKIGKAYCSSLDLIIADEIGEAMHPSRFTSSFRKALREAGLPDSGPHIMRHTCASLSLAAGANALVVSQALGHHDPGFTLRQYAHVMPGLQTQAASALNVALREAPSGGNHTEAVARETPA